VGEQEMREDPSPAGIFEYIAPHLNQMAQRRMQEVYPKGLVRGNGSSMGNRRSGKLPMNMAPETTEVGRKLHRRLYTIDSTNLIPLYDSFYLADPISRASITMGKCSNLFKTHNFDI